MTPELIELARAAMALPGAPKAPLATFGGSFRGRDGIQWIDVADDSADDYEWLPDLTDPATGGVLVSMLGFEARRVRATASMHKYAAGYRWGAEMPFEAFPILCHTQAEAACRVAVDIGGWK